jgi:DNA invertase Pin-like site-specific DNA recombinase
VTRAALLARVSSSAQSADMQLDELRAVARHRKWSVVLEETDTGSGAGVELPGRARVLEAARRGRVDVIAVWRLDRLGRSLRDLLEIGELLERAHVDLVSLRDAIETSTPAGKLLFAVLGAIAQFERELIGERVRAGIAHARARGVAIGRPRVDVDVAHVLELRGMGYSMRAIERKLAIPARTLERAVIASAQRAVDEHRGVRQKPTARTGRDRRGKPSASSSSSSRRTR